MTRTGKPALAIRRRPLRTWAGTVVRGRIATLMHQLERLERKPDPRAIHEVRVASRRLRATLRHLGPCFRGDRAERFRLAVRRVADALGKVRDLDILIHNLDGDAQHKKSSVAQLVKRMRTRRNERLERALPDARLLLHQLPAWRERLEKDVRR